MKKAIFVAAVLSIVGISAIPGYAKDDMAMPTSKATSQKAIVGKGTVVSANKSGGNVTLKHEAIPAIGWGAMTMEFKVKDKMLLEKVKKGDNVEFTLVPEGQDYVITSIK